MAIMFATCEPTRAFQFLKTKWSGITEEEASVLLDWIRRDVIRITDPGFHTLEVVPGRNWDESLREQILAECRRLQCLYDADE